jgi:hypothetical protein
MRYLSGIVAIAGLTVFGAAAALAHHSPAFWDKDHRITLIGSVSKVSFSNPHVRVHFSVKDEKGDIEEWTAQSAPPYRLRLVGWTSDTLKPGDRITVTGLGRRAKRCWRELTDSSIHRDSWRCSVNIPKTRERPVLSRIGIAFLLILFCSQSSRFYTVTNGCWHGPKDGYSLQHCKDAPGTVGTRLGQPAVLPAADPPEAFQPAWVHTSKYREQMLDYYLSPPFHPPR